MYQIITVCNYSEVINTVLECQLNDKLKTNIVDLMPIFRVAFYKNI